MFKCPMNIIRILDLFELSVGQQHVTCIEEEEEIHSNTAGLAKKIALLKERV